MIVADIFELTIVGVYDRGVPNRERIVLAANQQVNMGQYGLMIGIRGPEATAVPIRDNLLWFGDGLVNKGDLIFAYTGPGAPRVTPVPNNPERLITVHWGRSTVFLGDENLVPILFRVDAVMIPTDAPLIPMEASPLSLIPPGR